MGASGFCVIGSGYLGNTFLVYLWWLLVDGLEIYVTFVLWEILYILEEWFVFERWILCMSFFGLIYLHTVKWLNRSIWPIVGIQTGTTTPGQSIPGNNGNRGALHIPLGSGSEDDFVAYTEHSLVGAVFLFCRDDRLILPPQSTRLVDGWVCNEAGGWCQDILVYINLVDFWGCGKFFWTGWRPIYLSCGILRWVKAVSQHQLNGSRLFLKLSGVD